MLPLDIVAIEQQARRMRAEELRRIQGLMAKRIALYFRLLGNSAADVSEAVRPLFSWNTQDVNSARPASGSSLLTRASLMLRSLFSWNPQAHRS